MTDIVQVNTDTGVQTRFKDMGDGTYAEVVTIGVTLSGSTRQPVEPLGAFVANNSGTAGSAASTAVALSATTKRVSVQSSGAALRFAFGTSTSDAQTRVQATATSVRVLAESERDFAVPVGSTHYAYMRAGTTDASIEVTELT